jgi:hypothetical protein
MAEELPQVAEDKLRLVLLLPLVQLPVLLPPPLVQLPVLLPPPQLQVVCNFVVCRPTIVSP